MPETDPGSTMPRAVLFDLDGVLVDSYAIWRGLVAQAVRHFTGRDLDDQTFARTWGQSMQADIETYFPGLTVDELERFYCLHYKEHVHRVEVLDGARDGLLACRSRRLPTALITNSPSDVARSVLAETGLDAWLDAVVGASDVERPKPWPDVVNEACRRLGVEPRAAMVVGDTRFDLDAARAAGALPLLVGDGEPDVRGVARIASLRQLGAFIDERPPGSPAS